ncbi:unnamed protein product, partial [Staurois parvus]
MSLDMADHVVKGPCDWPFTTSRDQLCPALKISALMIGAQQCHPPVPSTCAHQCHPQVPISATHKCPQCPAVPPTCASATHL